MTSSRPISRRRYASLLPVLLLLAPLGCGSGGSGRAQVSELPEELRLEPSFPGLAFQLPVAALQAPGDAGRWFVVEKGGTVRSFLAGAASPSTFVDISDRVDAVPGEAGLLGLAFHPDWQTNREVFLSYTAPGPGGAVALVSRLSRFRSTDGGATLDPATEEILLAVDQPFANHNGGHAAFGPDGFLYLGLGDGGSGGDPLGHGQDTETLLGAFLRLDVDAGAPYAIPPGNPFAQGGGRPEIFAWGFRNPWRWSFDRATGELWCGDVGQGAWEEVNQVLVGRNYGWNVREGAHCFGAATCDTVGLEDPVAEYSHAEGCSVTGGYVYRGTRIPSLTGTYVYGDFCSGTVWGLAPGNREPRVLVPSGLNISSFAEGSGGELHVLDYASGEIFHLMGP
ncbi:MAG: PQQ-dependent sugar dehydrogenase [Thermodesulfobacteriota bacterium]